MNAATPPERARVGLVEDDPVMGGSLVQRLRLEGWDVAWWRTGREALAAMPSEAAGLDLVICDIRLPDISGERLFEQVARHPGMPPFLFVTGFAEIDQAVRLMRAGAVDFMTKPFAMEDFLNRIETHRRNARSGLGMKDYVLGRSPAIQHAEDLIHRYAAHDLPVLVTGETGSGKEVAARLLHQASSRAEQPFVAVNCAAIPADLLESEIFGHEKGAFTGAHRARRGLFREAHGGTIFLDEVGELSPQVQVMLLRVLQERTLRRVGGERSITVDVRVLAATHRDLAQRVREGLFREDLYYRLSGVALHVPPLRERTADLPAMIRTFLAEATTGSERRPPAVDAEVLRVLARYPWPGNVRQLRSEVARWTVFCDEVVTVADLSPELLGEAASPSSARSVVAAQPSQPALEPLAAVLERAERAAIEAAYQRLSGNLSRCAQTLGIGRNTLKRKLRAWGHLPTRAKAARSRRSAP